MFEYFKSMITIPTSEKDSFEQKLQVATCALFFEIAKADENFTDEEHEKIISIMKKRYDMNDDEADELMSLTEESIKRSVSIYEFATLVDQNFSKDKKLELMKNLWQLIYTDKKLDKYEDNLIKRIGDILKLEHKEVIEAKLIVKSELGL
ncbi:MAG: TerB family tellurite resistance protein [Ignavibacteriaceae bacterium]